MVVASKIVLPIELAYLGHRDAEDVVAAGGATENATSRAAQIVQWLSILR